MARETKVRSFLEHIPVRNCTDSSVKGYCFREMAVLEFGSFRLLVLRNRANPGGVNGNNNQKEFVR
jgi:hypothetical protein